jgi:hypothetical protein
MVQLLHCNCWIIVTWQDLAHYKNNILPIVQSNSSPLVCHDVGGTREKGH